MYNRMYECDSKQVQLSVCALRVSDSVYVCANECTCGYMCECVCLNAWHRGRATGQV